jgi:hypothetical protein
MALSLKDEAGEPNAFSDFLDLLIDYTLVNKDSVSAITGYNGSGKSTLGIQVCQEIGRRIVERKLVEKPWDMFDDAIWKTTKDELKTKIYAKKFTPCLLDEMLTVANKHNWASTLALYAESLFLVNRTQNRAYFMISPRMGGFAETFRNQRIVFDFLIIETGKGVVLMRHPDTNVSDPWFLKGLEKDITSMNGDRREVEDFMFGSNRLAFYRDRPNYVCSFSFTKLDKRTQKEYDVLRARLVNESTEIGSARTDKEKTIVAEKQLISIAKAMLLAGKDIREIAKDMGTNTVRVNALLKKASEVGIDAGENKPEVNGVGE